MGVREVKRNRSKKKKGGGGWGREFVGGDNFGLEGVGGGVGVDKKTKSRWHPRKVNLPLD